MKSPQIKVDPWHEERMRALNAESAGVIVEHDGWGLWDHKVWVKSPSETVPLV